MAKLTVKIAHTGEEIEVFDIDFKQLTPRQLIDEMINQGLLSAETTSPYRIVNKDGMIVDYDDLCLSFDQLGFVDGDTIRIILKPTGGDGSPSVTYPNNSISGFTYDPVPFGYSLEDKAQQLADEMVAMSQLELLKHEEERCRRHIDSIRHGIEEQMYEETYYMIPKNKLPSVELQIFAQTRSDTVQKIQDLLSNRLEQLQYSPSPLDRFRGAGELRLIKELLILIDSLENERMEMMRYVEDLFQKKMREAEQKFLHEGIRANKNSVHIMESYLSDYKRDLHDLIDRRQSIEYEIDRKKKEKAKGDVYSSIFAPAEVKRESHMLVQVYLHLYEETEKVKALALEPDKDAKRRDYIPLQCKLKKGDTVDVLMSIYGETKLMSEKKRVVWEGSFTKCSFDYFVPKDLDIEELSCMAMLSVNGVPTGEMRFITKVVEKPRQLNPEILSHKYNKVFISYSHHDESKVRFLHEGLELGAVPHFFDRKYLKAGDVFPQVIRDYINSADLFILCWSENASKSEYVQKERLQAMKRAYPQIQPESAAKLRIYPMSFEPRAELPKDMKDNYHFTQL